MVPTRPYRNLLYSDWLDKELPTYRALQVSKCINFFCHGSSILGLDRLLLHLGQLFDGVGVVAEILKWLSDQHLDRKSLLNAKWLLWPLITNEAFIQMASAKCFVELILWPVHIPSLKLKEGVNQMCPPGPKQLYNRLGVRQLFLVFG